MASTPEKLYFDKVNKVLRLSTGAEINNDSLFPKISITQKMKVNLQIVKDDANTAYTDIPSGATLEGILDNDYNNSAPILELPGDGSDWTAAAAPE